MTDEPTTPTTAQPEAFPFPPRLVSPGEALLRATDEAVQQRERAELAEASESSALDALDTFTITQAEERRHLSLRAVLLGGMIGLALGAYLIWIILALSKRGAVARV